MILKRRWDDFDTTFVCLRMMCNTAVQNISQKNVGRKNVGKFPKQIFSKIWQKMLAGSADIFWQLFHADFFACLRSHCLSHCRRRQLIRMKVLQHCFLQWSLGTTVKLSHAASLTICTALSSFLSFASSFQTSGPSSAKTCLNMHKLLQEAFT